MRLALLLLALSVAPALAAEGESGGMPQLNPASFAPQLFWLLITFVLLYWAMSKVALPRVGRVLESRAAKISGDLDQAARLKAEAEQVSAVYQKALADARAQATQLNRDTAARLAATAAERQAKLAGELAARIRTAEGEIAQAKTAAMANLVQVAGEAAANAAAKLVSLQVSGADAAAAAQSVLRERG